MTQLLLIPLDDTVVFPTMDVTLPVNVGDDERDARDIVVIGGGIIPQADIPLLKEMGVAEVFTPGAPTTAIVEWVQSHVVDDSAAHA